jgi:hypothetical protein
MGSFGGRNGRYRELYHGHFFWPQPRTRVAMSPWLDLLLNVIAIAGFLAVATYHRPAKKGDGLD